MPDKLLVEVEMVEGKAENAIFGLLNLANRLVESPQFMELREWKEYDGDEYRLKWRFTDGSYEEVCKERVDCQSPFIQQGGQRR